jgi:tripeptide aminopeptidase
VAAAFLDALPKVERSPETTEGKEGFVHPVECNGLAEQVRIQFILRDFETAKLDDHFQLLKDTLESVLQKFPGARYRLERQEQYRNMKQVLDQHPQVVALAKEAIQKAGIPLRMLPVRGGTDGSRLSFMGLPCPNLFTGEMALHSRQEYVSVQDMEKSVEVVLSLAEIWTRQ